MAKVSCVCTRENSQPAQTEIVDMPQVFLPFATDAKGQTLYEKMVEGKFCWGMDSSVKMLIYLVENKLVTLGGCPRISRSAS